MPVKTPSDMYSVVEYALEQKLRRLMKNSVKIKSGSHLRVNEFILIQNKKVK